MINETLYNSSSKDTCRSVNRTLGIAHSVNDLIFFFFFRLSRNRIFSQNLSLSYSSLPLIDALDDFGHGRSDGLLFRVVRPRFSDKIGEGQIRKPFYDSWEKSPPPVNVYLCRRGGVVLTIRQSTAANEIDVVKSLIDVHAFIFVLFTGFRSSEAAGVYYCRRKAVG